MLGYCSGGRRRVPLASVGVAVAAFLMFAVAGTAAAAHHHRHYRLVHATNNKPFGTVGSASILGAVKPFVGNGLGPLPPATSSGAGLEGGADLSDGITPAPGGLETEFDKGYESYNGSYTTTVVNFTLPQGVTLLTDPSCASYGNPVGYCLYIESNCYPNGFPYITVSGNEVDFRAACNPGQYFFWAAEPLSSLISTPGLYDTSVQFKVGTFNRSKGGTNMWQIKMPGSFEVFGP